MKLTIEINLDNATFTENLSQEDTAEVHEIRYALDNAFFHLRTVSLGDDGIIMDSNGNTVGYWDIEG